MVTVSDELAGAEPPPETEAVFVSGDEAPVRTLTKPLIGG